MDKRVVIFIPQLLGAHDAAKSDWVPLIRTRVKCNRLVAVDVTKTTTVIWDDLPVVVEDTAVCSVDACLGQEEEVFRAVKL